MGTVNFNGQTVSDEEVKIVLQAIGKELKSDVNVTSGDRNFVPPGGSNTSLHLAHRAADFHIDGLDDGSAYQQIVSNALNIFEVGYRYEFIWHGIHTETTGAHLHIGRIGISPVGIVKFIKEGLTASTKGKYTTDFTLPIVYRD